MSNTPEADPSTEVVKPHERVGWRRHAMALGALGASAVALAIGGEKVLSSGPTPESGRAFPVTSGGKIHGDILVPRTSKLQLRPQQSVPDMRWASPQLERTTIDRPDEVAGPLVHVVYVVPKNVADRNRDTNGDIETRIWSALNWQTGSTEGPSFRMDTKDSRLDISFFPSSFTPEQLYQRGSYAVEDIRQELWSNGYEQDEDKKILLAFIESKQDASKEESSIQPCGVANWPPQVPGNTAIVSLYERCDYYNELVTHEVGHVRGAVPLTSLRHDPASPGHSVEQNDVMYNYRMAGQSIDPGRDDYWHLLQQFLTDENYKDLQVDISGGGLAVPDQEPNQYLGQARADCHEDCRLSYPAGAIVNLKPVADDDTWRFKTWGKACQGKNTCTVGMTSDKAVEAVFEPVVNLGVKVRGPGKLKVIGQKACAKTCEYQLPAGRNINIVAMPNKRARVVRWLGPCAATKTIQRCTLPLKHGHDPTATAVFGPKPAKP